MKRFLNYALLAIIILLLSYIAYENYHGTEKIVTKYSTIEVPTVSVEKDAYIRQVVESKDSAMHALLRAKDQVKRYTTLQTQLRIDTLRIPLRDTIYVTKVKEKVVEKVVYRTFAYQDPTLSFNGKVGPTDLSVDSLIVNAQVSMLTVHRKEKGFLNIFNKRKTKVLVVSDNPRVRLTGTTDMEVQAPTDNYWKGYRDGAITGGVVGVGLQLIK